MKPLRIRSTSGFAVIDLAVVCAISSLVAAVTIPALQDARIASRASLCKNNLKQLGFAFHNYHDVHNRFPAGWYCRYPEADSVSWLGWQHSLLPYVNQQSLYDRIYGDNSAPEWPAGQWTRTAIPAYRCPTDTTGPLNPMRGNFGTSSYSGNAGANPFPRLYSGEAEQFWPGGLPVSGVGNRQAPSGMFAVNASLRIRDVVDGTSNTLMIAERSAISGSGLWAGVRSNRTDNDAVTEFSHRSRINKTRTGASSFHKGGIQVCFADGSVKFISENIASGPTTDSKNTYQTLQRLACRNDGNPVGEF